MAKSKTIENRVMLKYLIEQGTKAKVLAANEDIKRSMKAIADAAKDGGKINASQMRNITKETNVLRKELLDLEDGFHEIGSDVPKELQDVIDKVDQLNKGLKSGADNVRDFDDEFSKTSKNVALAGDVESQARTIGGLAGVTGAVGLERTIGAGAEIFAVTEALPKLKTSLRGMPSVISSFATTLGPVGLGLTAVTIGVGIAVAGLVSNMKEQAEAAKALIAAEEEFFTARATGTKESVQGQIDANDIELQIRRDRIASLEEQRDAEKQANLEARVEQKNLFAAVATGIADVFQTDAQEEFEKAISEINDEMVVLLDTNNLLIQGLTDQEFATESAAEAEARLAEERSKAGLAAVAAAERERSRIITEQGLIEQSVEALDARKKAIENEVIAIRASLQVLQDRGAVSAEVDASTRAFILTPQDLETEMSALEGIARPLAVAREAEATAAEEAIVLAEERATADRKVLDVIRETLEKRAALEKKFANELVELSKRAAEESAKALSRLEEKLATLNQSLGRDLEDQQRKQQRKLLEAQIDGQRQEVRERRDHVNRLEDITRKADETEFSLRQARDFKGVANARRTARIQIQDEQRNFARSEKDRIEKLQQEAGDRQIAFAEERRDRLRKFQQDIADARANFIRQRSEQQLANIQAIMQARQKHQQELSDLQQAGIQALTIRRQITDIELAMLRQVADTARGFLQQVAAFRSTQGSTNITTSTRSNTNNLNISGQNLENAQNVASTIFRVLQGLVQ